MLPLSRFVMQHGVQSRKEENQNPSKKSKNKHCKLNENKYHTSKPGDNNTHSYRV